MRITAFFTCLVIVLTASLLSSCAKKEQQGPAVSFTSFSFKAAANPGLTADVNGIVNGNNVVVKLPAAADISALVPSYEFGNPETIVYVNKIPQENGITVMDFSSPVEYQLKGRQSRASYTVTVTKTASFTKFGFTMADNPGVLLQDYIATIKGLNVNIEVPYGTDITKLKPAFETTSGAVVKYNGNVEQSASAFHDFTTPVQYQLTDIDTPTPAVFTVSVGYPQIPVWQKVNEASLPLETAVSGVRMAVNPVTNKPFMVYQLSRDAAGTSLASADKKVAVVTNNGSGWEYVGSSSGISDGDGRDPSIAFDKNGVLYVAYRDYADVSANQQKVTVKKFENGSWVNVGPSRFTPSKTDYLSFAIDELNRPWISMGKQDNAADASGMERRQLYTMKFENNAWSIVPMPARFIISETKMVMANNRLYLGVIDRTAGSAAAITAFENIGGQWSVVGSPAFMYNSKSVNVRLAMAVGQDGAKYIAYQSGSGTGKVDYVMSHITGNWDKIGADMAVGSVDDRFALAVHPDGTLYFAYQEPGMLTVANFDKETNNWSPNKVNLVKETVTSLDMAVSADGIPYLLCQLSSTSKLQVYKFAIPR